MKLLVVTSFIIPLIFIWYLLSRLGDYLDKKPLTSIASDEPGSSVVLGSSPIADMTARLLEEQGYHVIRQEDPFQLTQEKRLHYLFALSDSDADNIALCKIGKKLYFIKNSISLCNDKRNENMFISEKINFILAEETSADKLIQMVLQQPEVNCEYKQE